MNPGDHAMSEALRGLVEVHEIEGIIKAYCRHLDAMDLDALAGLFTEDCLVEYGPEAGMTSHGRERLARDLARLWRWARTSHHLSNIEVFFDGEDGAARAISYVLAWHEAPGGSTATLYGQYHDRLTRTAEGWRIAHRKQYMNGNDSGFTVKIHPFPRRPKPA